MAGMIERTHYRMIAAVQRIVAAAKELVAAEADLRRRTARPGRHKVNRLDPVPPAQQKGTRHE